MDRAARHALQISIVCLVGSLFSASPTPFPGCVAVQICFGRQLASPRTRRSEEALLTHAARHRHALRERRGAGAFQRSCSATSTMHPRHDPQAPRPLLAIFPRRRPPRRRREEIDRLNAIGMPPAYERCWFCPYADGHIQSTGYDAKGRKQYRYHPDFRAQRETLKYERLAAFGGTLPKLRKKVGEDLQGNPTAVTSVLAAVVRLIDETRMRVGNEEYAKQNRARRDDFAQPPRQGERGKLKITYTGKHGVRRHGTIARAQTHPHRQKDAGLPARTICSNTWTEERRSARHSGA